MTPDPLDEVSRVYHAALERAAGERRAFLEEACAGNEALRREVASLLGYEDAAGEFIEAPALLAAAEGFGHSAILTGRQIGSYTVQALIDAGGMGEVYSARDTKLGRDVAIKVLPPAFMADPARRARFEREARLLAAVNHPNIAQIYGLEESDGAQALVMELVPGETLAALLGSTARGTSRTAGPRLALSLDESLSIARQVADAVEAAHEKGVLHRDLKPANVRVTPEGVVKVLDFGLAKAFAVDPARGESQDLATPGATGDGVILGTGAYMSPEQARGLPVDKRTDIWAFGCVLYEMLTGRRAFEASTLTDILAAILEREPDWHALPATTPSRVRELLERCLVKDPRRRLRDIGDARSHLDSLEPVMPRSSTQPLPASRTRERVWMSVAALTALAALGAIGWRQDASTPVPNEVAFAIQPPDGYTFPPLPGNIAISPNGQHLAFVAGKDGGNQLFVRDLDKVEARLLPGTEGASQPTWSPDSRFVAFIDSRPGNKLKKVDIVGGTPQPIADNWSSVMAWSRDGVILLTGRGGILYRIPDNGGQATAVVEPDASRQEMAINRPSFLPDGRRFFFQAWSQNASQNALFIASLEGGSRRHLLDALSTVAYADGYLLYQRDGTLMAQPFDDKEGRLIGDAVPVVEGLLTTPRGFAEFSIADDGTLAYRADSESGVTTLTWFDRRGDRVGTVGGPGVYENPRLSRDGRWLAVCRKENGQHDIWVVDLERNVPIKLTTDPAVDDFPVWSHDGKHVIFASNRKGVVNLYRRAADGSGTDELLFESAEIKRPTDVSPDGTLLLFTLRTGGGSHQLDVWGLQLTGDRKAFPILASPGSDELNAVFRPDGQWIAYEGRDTSALEITTSSGLIAWTEIYLQPFPTTGERIKVSTARGTFPRWTAGGKQLIFNQSDSLTVVNVTDPRRPGTPQALSPSSSSRVPWVVDGEGQRFLRPASAADAAPQPITVVVNWTAGLRRK